MANSKNRDGDSSEKTGANQREGDTGRTSSQRHKEALGGGKAKKVIRNA
jgi:hypothetical protein